MKRIALIPVVLLLQATLYAQDMPAGKQVYSSDFVIDGLARYISFYLPANYGAKDFYPLLIVLPAKADNGKNFIRKYGDMLHARADSAGCVVLYPEALPDGWHGGEKDTVNDAGFINIMITYFLQQYHCNPAQVYVAGMETGGSLAYRMACQYPHLLTAIAAFGDSANCSPAASVTVMDTRSIPVLPGKLPYSEALLRSFAFLLAQSK